MTRRGQLSLGKRNGLRTNSDYTPRRRRWSRGGPVRSQVEAVRRLTVHTLRRFVDRNIHSPLPINVRLAGRRGADARSGRYPAAACRGTGRGFPLTRSGTDDVGRDRDGRIQRRGNRIDRCVRCLTPLSGLGHWGVSNRSGGESPEGVQEERGVSKNDQVQSR
jgi:hypothetical protein